MVLKRSKCTARRAARRTARRTARCSRVNSIWVTWCRARPKRAVALDGLTAATERAECIELADIGRRVNTQFWLASAARACKCSWLAEASGCWSWSARTCGELRARIMGVDVFRRSSWRCGSAAGEETDGRISLGAFLWARLAEALEPHCGADGRGRSHTVAQPWAQVVQELGRLQRDGQLRCCRWDGSRGVVKPEGDEAARSSPRSSSHRPLTGHGQEIGRVERPDSGHESQDGRSEACLVEAFAAPAMEGTTQRAVEATQMSFKPLPDLLTRKTWKTQACCGLEDALRHGDIQWCLLVGCE